MLDQIVLVEWEDAFGCPAGWVFEDELDMKVTKVQSVGRYIREDDNSITIAPHVSTSERRQLAGHITIPRRQIIGIRVIYPEPADGIAVRFKKSLGTKE